MAKSMFIKSMEKPITFQQNLFRKFLQNQPFFTNCFSAKFARKCLQIIHKISRFSTNLSLKIPQNLTFSA